MDMSDLPEPLRARMAERDARSSMKVLQDFVARYLPEADGVEEMRADFLYTAGYNVSSLRQDLKAIEAVLAERPAAGVLSRLVAWEGNWVLDDPSDEGAARFLGELAQVLREVIGRAEAG
ncbi:hypothetical protein GCM10010435_46360 [Winogradskya consettensis]|uniref:CdiI immunity protein domain-containing protein n=1 Tax=Winogradskya consettensis TaxID=113560 RepID=A0A919T3M2_9ACTN|nr:hypothetical protein [Actinoplanes consettensis]GIM83061.1 hypothetical protein Aco04nite_84740 [Actinoplanes consettensis]